MVIDPGPTSEPVNIVRKVDLDNLPERVIVEGLSLRRCDLRPRYHANKRLALRTAANRVIRFGGHDMRRGLRMLYAKYLR